MANNDNMNKPPVPTIRGGGGVIAIIPQDMDQVWRMAGMAVMGKMAPKSLVEGKSFDEAQAACAVAIMAGAELGMTPLTALRSYAVVNGRPSLWGDGIKAVVRQSGKCEFIRTGGDLTKGWCEAKRTDTGEELRKEFTWAQAQKAKLDRKTGPWQEYPDMMMERRATFRCLNDLFADVLGGLADASDPLEAIDITPSRAEPPTPPEPPMPPMPPTVPPAADEPTGQDDAGQTGEATAGEDGGQEPPYSPTAARYLIRLEEDLAGADTVEEIETLFDDANPQVALADEGTVALAAAFEIKQDRLDAINQGTLFSEDDLPAATKAAAGALRAG